MPKVGCEAREHGQPLLRALNGGMGGSCDDASMLRRMLNDVFFKHTFSETGSTDLCEDGSGLVTLEKWGRTSYGVSKTISQMEVMGNSRAIPIQCDLCLIYTHQ